ncbi:hypothetical protein MKZ38_000279 [Zalerion maritima]|uniref:Cytochrome b5 heme-binding domain-containing protein n=1 Tax=Zalerion maritima TaxID=339359 RepID=A0AAD5RFC5_9PEZI|nr:hypothetical protein MKZ38_000279 [Zalerion maritima]
MSKEFTPAEVAQNKSEKSMMIIIDGSVYDVASFIDEHPGGPKILKRFAGKNASKAFWKYHSKSVLEKYGENLKVGTVKEAAKL